jgi:hypothetical protein
MSEKLHELQRLWLIEATRYGVLPLDDRVGERILPEVAGRPTLIKGNSQLLFGGMGRLSENSVVNIKNKSHSVSAEVVVPESGAEGVIVAQGGMVSLYLDGERIGDGRVDATAAMIFSADDTCDVGREGGALVAEDCGPRDNAFTGEVDWVQIDLGKDAEDDDHLISAEERVYIAMARQ